VSDLASAADRLPPLAGRAYDSYITRSSRPPRSRSTATDTKAPGFIPSGRPSETALALGRDQLMEDGSP